MAGDCFGKSATSGQAGEGVAAAGIRFPSARIVAAQFDRLGPGRARQAGIQQGAVRGPGPWKVQTSAQLGHHGCPETPAGPRPEMTRTVLAGNPGEAAAEGGRRSATEPRSKRPRTPSALWVPADAKPRQRRGSRCWGGASSEGPRPRKPAAARPPRQRPRWPRAFPKRVAAREQQVEEGEGTRWSFGAGGLSRSRGAGQRDEGRDLTGKVSLNPVARRRSPSSCSATVGARPRGGAGRRRSRAWSLRLGHGSVGRFRSSSLFSPHVARGSVAGRGRTLVAGPSAP